jgi:glutamine phosphoribosylpyrophosphate amidotransferase
MVYIMAFSVEQMNVAIASNGTMIMNEEMKRDVERNGRCLISGIILE